MDQKTVDAILVSIQNLKKVQRVIANKVIKLSDDLENKFATLEKKTNDRFDIYDKELKTIKEPNETLKISVEKHSDDVAKIEAELEHNAGPIEILDNNLQEMDTKIEASEILVKKLENDLINQNNVDKSEIKQCMFDRKGFCREQESCKFYHTDQICEIYIANQMCWKQNCKLRHPKHCRYF